MMLSLMSLLLTVGRLLHVGVRILVMGFRIAPISGLGFACLWLVDIQFVMRPFDGRKLGLIIELL